MKGQPNLHAWYQGKFISEKERALARLEFTRFLLPSERKVLTPRENVFLSAPLDQAPAEIQHLGAWVGKTSGGPERPDVVVAGVCQGKSDEEKEHWLKWGPTIETICGLDFAAAVARHHRSKLHLWIVSQEYANLAGPRESDVKRELAIGEKCASVLTARYPGATLFNTQNRAHRGWVYAAASETGFSRIYPHGVRKPYGIESPSFWDQLDYSSCLGSMVLPALDKLRVWAVVDHDQLRPASGAAGAFPKEITALYYWPVPNLAWNRSHQKTSGDFFAWLRLAPRRMHRHSDFKTKLHLFEPEDSLAAKAAKVRPSHSHDSPSSLDEILCYLDHSSESPNPGSTLVEKMNSFRRQIYPVHS